MGKRIRLDPERRRLSALFSLEKKWWERGIANIAGVDEAGRGPWAGPVVAASVIFPQSILDALLHGSLTGLNDSKRLSPASREKLLKQITGMAVGIGIAVIEPHIIDQVNILKATWLAMERAIHALPLPPEVLLVDGNFTIPGIGALQEAIVKGDARSASIAASSIVAKVTRDRMMDEYDLRFPEYGFASHKGYGTRRHLDALRKHGPSPIHRLSFSPVREHHPHRKQLSFAISSDSDGSRERPAPSSHRAEQK